MKVREISKDNWCVEVTTEDRRKIACIVQKLKFAPDLPPYGKWKEMSSQEIWEEILVQLCVMGGAKPIERLTANEERYAEFVRKLGIENLLEIAADRKEYISKQLKEYKATRFHNKNAERINSCLENDEIVKDGKIILLEELKNRGIDNEDKIRDILLKKMPFFKIKSVSDLMITIGAARGLIAFDTRIVGLLNKYFGLNRKPNLIQYNERLYKKIEGKLRDVCKELGIELSLLDRILFAEKSAIEYLLETECL